MNVKRLAQAIADHGDICSRMALPECATAIAATYDRLPPVQVRRFQNHGGGMAEDPEGQWVHVSDLGAAGWKLDPLPSWQAEKETA